MYAGVGGGLYVGGGMYAGAGTPYESNMPPWPHFLREIDSLGYIEEASLIREHLPEYLWPENFF